MLCITFESIRIKFLDYKLLINEICVSYFTNNQEKVVGFS